jgi:hypothetical protein
MAASTSLLHPADSMCEQKYLLGSEADGSSLSDDVGELVGRFLLGTAEHRIIVSGEEHAEQTRYAESLERILQPDTRWDEAIHAGALLRAKNADLFFSVLVSGTSDMDEANTTRLSRTLNLLQELGYYDPVLPWLHGLAQHAPERVKSKAVKLLCRAMPHKLLIELLLGSCDSRVRANAIEALWFHQTPESTKIFRDALSDPSRRVVVNALIGLCHQNDPTAREKLIGLLQHPCEMFRAAAIWACSHLYEEGAIPALQLLKTDPSEVVREKAANVLAELLYPREWIPSKP